MQLIGHQKQWQYLKRSAENERLAHAYLFHGPAEIGKRTFAVQFSKSLQRPGERLANFFLIEPVQGAEEENKRESIHILQIREIKEKLSLYSATGGYKIVVIDNAWAMTLDAQGAMLKLLEEPKEKTLFILIAESKDQLLETIVSRCESIKFFPLLEKEIKHLLRGLSDSEKKTALWLSFGRPGRLLRYLDQREEQSLQKKRVKEIGKLVSAPVCERFALAEKLSKNRNELLLSLEVWLRYFREVLLKKLRGEETKKNYSFEELKEIVNAAERTKFVLTQSNVNPRLALENFLLKI